MEEKLVKPEYILILDKLGVPPEKREQYLQDLVTLISISFDAYFAELDNGKG
jgi:hypothetical protein